MEAGEGLAFPETPRAAFSLHSGKEPFANDLPDDCPALTPHTFEKEETSEAEIPVSVTLGFVSREAKASFYSDMAARMAGETPPCWA